MTNEFEFAGRRTIWSLLGFGHRAGPIDWRAEDPPPGAWWKPGALVTEIEISLDWREKLRLLFGGRLGVEVSTRTDQIIRRAESRSVCSVLPPAGAVLVTRPIKRRAVF